MLLKVVCILCLATLSVAAPGPNPQQIQYIQQQQHEQQPQYQQPQYQQPIQYASQSAGFARPVVYQQQQLPTQQFRVAAAPQALATYQPGARVAGAIQAGQLAQGLAVKKVRPVAGGKLLAPGQQQLPEDYEPNPSYQFAFDVKDDEFTNYQNRKEERDGDTITGSYSVVDSDGYIRTVTYTADPVGGFKAEVVREPTDIVVKIPQPILTQPLKQQPQYYLKAGPGQAQQPAGIRYASPALLANQAGVPVAKATKLAQPVRVAAVRKIPAGHFLAGGQPIAYAAQPAAQYQQ